MTLVLKAPATWPYNAATELRLILMQPGIE
jgi:hypothetical protein